MMDSSFFMHQTVLTHWTKKYARINSDTGPRPKNKMLGILIPLSLPDVFLQG